MPRYTQRIRLEKHVEIEAKNAAEANSKLMDIVHDAEFASGFDNGDGYHEFTDEPITCPECDGAGVLEPDDAPDVTCPKCNGDGEIPFPG